jgi:molecular chaperone DnaK (HSP70)
MRVVEHPSPIVGTDGALAESLGIENAGDRFLALIPKGTRAPVSAMLKFTPSPARPTEIRFHLLRGISASPAGNHSLGHFRVTNLPAGAPAKPRAIIIFSVSGRVDGGAVQVAAVNPDTGEPLPLDQVPPESPH